MLQEYSKAAQLTYRFITNVGVLVGFTLLAAIAVTGFTLEQYFLLTNSHLDTNLLSQEVSLEDHSAVLIAAIGVVMELRDYMLYRMNNRQPPEHDDKFADTTVIFGIYLIMLGIIMEFIDQFYNLALAYGVTSFHFILGAVYSMLLVNIICLAVLLLYPVNIIKKSWFSG